MNGTYNSPSAAGGLSARNDFNGPSPMQCQAVDRREIAIAIDRLNGSLDRLEKIKSELLSKLSPIYSPFPAIPPGPGVVKPTEMRAPLACVLNERAEGLAEICNTLDALLGNIQL